MCEGPLWQSANLWWPEDRAWCVTTDIDFAWTYVGGDRSLIEELIGDTVSKPRQHRSTMQTKLTALLCDSCAKSSSLESEATR